MQKRRFIELLLLATLGAMAAAWFWALAPLLTPLFYLHPTGWTDADLIRDVWHFRLVQPEWVGTPNEELAWYLRWIQAETLARLILVFIAWATTIKFLERKYLRGQRDNAPMRPEPPAIALTPGGNKKATAMIGALIAWQMTLLAGHAQTVLDAGTEALIDQLPQVSEIGYGYSAMFSGSQFLPVKDTAQLETLVLGSPAPTNSATLELIVRRGVLAAPSLLKHLDDARETRIPPLSGMMWMGFDDEYDFNRRLRKEIPKGVNRNSFGEQHPRSHTITVGDLCFVALGQIVNRNFNATRYQPSGGLVVSSPTYSKQLCAVTRADFQGLDQSSHLQLLVQDFVQPDNEFRRNGACIRLAFYYPEEVEPLVLKQLAVPTYDVFKVEKFVRRKLYREQSRDKRQAIFEAFIRANGQAFSDGVLLQLFDDLDMQEADEQQRLSPALKQKYNARTLLTQLYGFAGDVASTNKPYINTWDATAEARFIEALASVASPKIDQVVDQLLRTTTDDDYLALACMTHLMGKGYETDIRRYCKLRIPKSDDYYAKQLRQILVGLGSRSSAKTKPEHSR